MCGGIRFQLNKIPRTEFQKFFTNDEIDKLFKKENYESFFWSPIPLLPIEKDDKIELIKWGNRSDQTKLPKTGWAKQESLKQGKWNYLHPEPTKISADSGFEKGVWFEIPSGGLKGIIINKNDEDHAYMVTRPADPDYLELTKHDRQPIEIYQN